MPPNVLVAQSRNKLPHHVLWADPGCTHFVAFYCLMGFIHETHVSPSSVGVKTKKASVLILASCRSCVLHNVLVARSRINFSQCVLCTNILALYFIIVFIGENTCEGHLVAS